MKLKMILLSFAFTSIWLPSIGQACHQCSSGPTYVELCAEKFVAAGYNSNYTTFASLCSPINSRAALGCVESLIDNNYSDISQDVMNGCSWATDCGVSAVRSLFDHQYNFVSGGLIKSVSSAHSEWQANCMIRAFDQGYSNLTEDNIIGLCP